VKFGDQDGEIRNARGTFHGSILPAGGGSNERLRNRPAVGGAPPCFTCPRIGLMDSSPCRAAPLRLTDRSVKRAQCGPHG
jgi:hypothetical protein